MQGGFPAFVFHPELGQRLVGSALELAALGPGWADTQQAPPVKGESPAVEEVIAPKADGFGSRLKNKKKAD